MILFLALHSVLFASEEFCTHDQLAKQDKKQLRITRNTVFARHGRAFKSKDLQDYFKQQPWYRVRKDFSKKDLTQSDRNCLDRVLVWEKASGQKILSADMNGDGNPDNIYFFNTRPKFQGNPDESIGLCEKSCFVHIGYDRFLHKLDVNWMQGGDYDKLKINISDIDVSTPQKEVYLQYYDNTNIDPALHSYFMWVYKGKSYQSSVQAYYYNSGALDFSKQGLVGVEDADDCVVSKKSWYSIKNNVMTKEKTDYTKDLSGGFMYEDGSGYGCSACPYVYLEHGSKDVLLGEILRNQIGQKAIDWDFIAIPTSRRNIRLSLAEEKKEITYLDTLYLQVGDVQLKPISCERDEESWCTLDKDFLHINQDEHVTFEFYVPSDVDIKKGSVSLHVHGYYIPVQ